MTEIPATLGPYPVLREIGRGGMGVVYLARDPRLDRPVALKVLPPGVADDSDRLARFEREARILASLRHPNIAGIYSIEQAEGRFFLVLEYVEGDTLAVRLAKGPLPVADALDVCRQVAAALEAAHETGIIHRDLKPGNVKITPAGEVRVLDFGIAKEVGGPAGAADLSLSPTITYATSQMGLVLGTAAYMSPEQARGRELDRRTDIWSFGCLLFECLTGRLAFPGETVSDTIAGVLERDPDLGALPGTAPVRVHELVARCLAKDARRRLRDIGEARILLEETLAARSASGRWRTAEMVAPLATRRRRGAWLAAAGAVVAVFAGIVAAPHLGAPRDTPMKCVAIPMPPGMNVRGSSITPDGRLVTVSGIEPPGPDSVPRAVRLYVRRIDEPEFQPVRGTEDFQFAYLTTNRPEMLLVVPVQPGSGELRLTRFSLEGSTPPTPICAWESRWRTLAPLEGGELLVADGPLSYRVLAEGADTPGPTRNIEISGATGVSQIDYTPWSLPGGRRAMVNVISYDERGWHSGVGVLDVAAGKVKVVIDDGGNAVYSRTGHLLFARGRLLYAVRFDPARLATRGDPVVVWSGLRTNWDSSPGFFRLTDAGDLYHAPGGRTPGRSLAFLGADGRTEPWSSERRQFDGAPEFSPDGRSFACQIVNARGLDEIWIGDLSRPGLRRLSTDPDADCVAPCWAPDGSRIAYRRNGKNDRDGVYVIGAHADSARRVLRLASPETSFRPLAWTRAGELLLSETAPGRERLVVLPPTSGEADPSRLRPLSGAEFRERGARLSPDEKWLAYLSNASGVQEVFVRASNGSGGWGPPVRVSPGQAWQCRWATQGSTLYFSDNRNRLFRMAISGGPEPRAGSPERIADFSAAEISAWTTAPGGRVFCSMLSEDETRITEYQYILNWEGELKRRMKAAKAGSRRGS